MSQIIRAIPQVNGPFEQFRDKHYGVHLDIVEREVNGR